MNFVRVGSTTADDPGADTFPVTLITSNGVAAPLDAAHAAPLTESTHLLADRTALRRRYADEGYLFLRGVLDPELVMATRAAYFEGFDPSYLAAGTAPRDGVFSGRRPGGIGAHGTATHPAHAFVRGTAWRRLIEDPALKAVAETILGGKATVLPRQIVRQFDRSVARASRAHVDHTYLDKGTGEIATVWIPLGDCPMETGPLVYLEDSHRMSPAELDALRQVTDRPEDARPLSHDLGWVSEQAGRRWRYADFTAGDVAVHCPHIVHASLDVRSDAMRLSADVRFIRDGGTPDPRWLTAWAGDDGN
jgi:ectoine hydroxylase-related dioxygenase (phytanoyl-CoA dioxygenase family)